MKLVRDKDITQHTMDDSKRQLKRILYIDPCEKLGGANISLIDLMTAIDTRRYIPILLCPNRGELSDKCHQNDIQVEYLPSIPINGGKPLDFARVLIPNTIAISKLIRQMNIALVHSNTWRVAYYSGLAARINHIPAVTHVRDYNESYRAWFKYWSFGLTSDVIIAESYAIQKSIQFRIPSLKKKITTIHFGLPTPPEYQIEQQKTIRAEFGMAESSPLIAVVGSFSRLKGQHIILKAMPKILSLYPKAKLLLIGEPLSKAQGPYCRELQNIVHRYGMEDHVIFTGFRRDVQLILASVDLLVHPPTLPDAFPHVLLEGGTQKALIVASRIGGISEIIEDGISGRLVTPGQPEILAEAIIDLLKHPLAAQKMREAIYKRVIEEFTLEQHVTQIQMLYEKLLANVK